jgi:hypothetical protein
MRQKLQWITLIIALCATHSFVMAGNYNFYGDARSAGMSNSVIMAPKLAYMQNQATLGWAESAGLSLYSFYRPQLPQLSVVAAHGNFNLWGGGFGIQMQRFGDNAYNENKIGLGCGKQLGEHFSAGVQFNYLYTDISGPYQTYHNFVAEAGVQASFGDKWLFGVHVYNPTLSRIGGKEEVPETIVRLGAGVKVTNDFLLTSEVEKHIDKEINFKVGADYEFEMGLNIQVGIQSAPGQASLGVGYAFSQFAVQVAVNTNTYLKPGTHFTVHYQF